MVTIPDDVIKGAQTAQAKWKIPASVSIAQWALESGWGAHIPEGSNNPFGLKVRSGKGDLFVLKDTWEVIHGKRVEIVARFRKFASISDAFMAKGELLATAPVYAHAFAMLPNLDNFIAKFAPTYATDPEYANKLHSIINQHALKQYDTHD